MTTIDIADESQWVLRKGQLVQVKILSVNQERKKIDVIFVGDT